MRSMPRILLSSVFGPYGVDDAYGRKQNIMELFHNQVTREQGIFSLRFNHQSFGLHLIAENILASTTILDFPSETRFIREIAKGYDYVGISFIVPNFVKAKRMAELVRKHSPRSKIVLGGHGTTIPGIERLIETDHICRGEGVRFFRELLGEDENRPISHPLVQASFNKFVLGVPLENNSAVLLPGVGCPNACRFCCTSHFFERQYTPFLKTGRELYEVCERAERELGLTEFFVMDENFLKYRQRAEEFLGELERHGKHYTFAIFSSAEAVREVGVDFMKRLGVYFLWIGMESKREVYAKNQGVDFPELVAELRSNGIVVLGSVILFAEHHTKETIQEDIDFAIESAPDFIQFMQLGPLPGTALYKSYESEGKLRKDIPYEEWHGQHRIWFDHPHFTAEESETYIRNAFQKAWDDLGCSLLRLIETTLMGYLSSRDSTDPALKARNRHFAGACALHRPGLEVIRRHAHNDLERRYAESLQRRCEEAFGPASPKQRLLTAAARTFAAIESRRIAGKGNLRQPTTLVSKVRTAKTQLATSTIPGRGLASRLQCEVVWSCGQASLSLAGVMDKVSAKALGGKIAHYFESGRSHLVLDIHALTRIHDDALETLLAKVKQHHGKLKLTYNAGKEEVRRLVEEVSARFGDLTFEPILTA